MEPIIPLRDDIAAFARTGDPNNKTLGTKCEPGAAEMMKKMVFDASYKQVKIYMAVY
jgi:hypothetical protein